jgi:hypothetical protein
MTDSGRNCGTEAVALGDIVSGCALREGSCLDQNRPRCCLGLSLCSQYGVKCVAIAVIVACSRGSHVKY